MKETHQEGLEAMKSGSWNPHETGRRGHPDGLRPHRRWSGLAGVALFFLAWVVTGAMAPPAHAQIFDRLRQKAEEALDEASVLQRLLEKPPGVTTSIRDAHTEVPFLDGHNPTSSALMAALPRDAENAFFAPPGLYEMQDLSFCIQAGTYGPTGGDGYALAPLQGELAPVLRTLVRRWVDHPEISQSDLQSLIWALQARTPINELPLELQAVASALLDPGQMDRLSEDVVDRAREEFMAEAMDRVPESVRRVAEVEAELRDLLRSGADFEELEAAAVLVGAPSPEELVREVPTLRWNYHPDGYFIRFDPEDYTLTRVQAYVPEAYRLLRDGEGRIVEVAGPRGIRLTLGYADGEAGGRENVGLLRRARLLRGGALQGSWEGEAWTFVGNDLGGGALEGVMTEAEWQARREKAREVREQTRDVMTSASGSDRSRPGRDLADLAHLRTALSEARGRVPEAFLTHLANAWQHALCVEAGGCPGPRAAALWIPEEAWGPGEMHGPAVHSGIRFYEPVPGAPLYQSGGGGNMGSGGNVAAPGNTGSQRLLQSGKSPKDKANLAMKALGVFLALADVLGSSGLGSAAYNALGAFGLPVGHLGLPMMMAGGMISQVMDVWTTATDALAGDTGSGGAGGDEGGGSGGDEGGGSGDSGGGAGGDPGDPGDPTDPGDPGGTGNDPSDPNSPEGWEETRSDGQDYEDTPPPSPPPNPSPPPPGNDDVSQERSEAYEGFVNSLIETLYYTQGLTDSQMRQEAACQAGDMEWAQQQADLAEHYQDQAGIGMMEVAAGLEQLLAVADAEGVLESSYAYEEEFAGVQERLRTQGWKGEEMSVADALRITPGEMEELRQYLISQDPEVMAGELGEAAELWAKEVRTAGILWLALPAPDGGCH